MPPNTLPQAAATILCLWFAKLAVQKVISVGRALKTAIKIVCASREIFRKDLVGYEVVSVYGENMVATDGAAWKRHRAIAKPAFNDANNAFVWLQSTRVANEWFTHLRTLSRADNLIKVDLVKDLTQVRPIVSPIYVALLILSSAAFGRHSSWAEDLSAAAPPGHRIAFSPAVITAMDNLIAKVLTPNWAYAFSRRVHIPYLSSVLKETHESFDALRLHMLDLVSEARLWVSGGKTVSMDAALLRNLVEANMDQESRNDRRKLTDEELLSNTFVKTSAHSLSFAIALLALYPDVQQKIYEEVLKVWPEGDATAGHMPYTTAAFNETLRLFPPVPRLTKYVYADTTLPARRFKESSTTGKISDLETYSVPIPMGSMVVIDIIALHMNPIHWGDDAAEFKPERFIDTETYAWPRDAFIAFSLGARACIGERFAMTESVCVLANLVRKFEILVPEELRSKSHAEQKKILLHWVPKLTLLPTDARVCLRSR
ncbi:cytochrome P450 [Mycena capillaripes]|nr:cytochrome P450 [Mycena capillaripes]